MLWVSSEQILIYKKSKVIKLFPLYEWLSLKYGTEETNFSVNVKTNSTVEQITLNFISKYGRDKFKKKSHQFLTARP